MDTTTMFSVLKEKTLGILFIQFTIRSISMKTNSEETETMGGSYFNISKQVQIIDNDEGCFKVDFIVLDLNHSSLETALESPGLLLLANVKNLANCKSDMELGNHLEKVQECLSDFDYEDTGYMKKEIYMVKELD